MSAFWVISALLGAAVGLWFRVSAVLILTILVAAATTGGGLLVGKPLGLTLIDMLVSVALLHLGYLGGLLVVSVTHQRSE